METSSATVVRWGIGCLALFALPFIGVGVGMAWWTAQMTWEHDAMQSWVEVPALIKHAELQRKHGDDGDTFRAVATYEYEFGGRRYTAERVSLHGGSDNIGSFQRRAHEELKRHRDTGRPFRCFCNPANPAESVLYRKLRWEMMAFNTLFATLFGGAGLGLLAGSVVAARRGPMRYAREAPADEPWRRRTDWTSGEISATGGAAVAVPVLAIVVFWWLVASAPLMSKIPTILLAAEDGPWRWIVVVYPLIGLLLVVGLVHQFMRRRKFGESILQLAATPGVVGGQLAGVVRIPRPVHAVDGFNLKLSCVERKSDGDEIREDVVWQDERRVMEPMRDEATGATIVPVLFAIPYDAQETSRAGTKRDIEWRLEVSAELPGVDYKSGFDVPVFKTADSRADFQLDEQLAADFVAAPPRESIFREAGIITELLAGGGVRLVFPAARNIGSAVVTTLFLSIWTAATGLMLHFDLFIIFPIVFSVFGLFILWLTLDLWLYRSVVEATRDGVSVRGGWLGIGRERRVAADDIRRFKSEEYMSSGTKRWTSIFVVPRRGKKQLLAKGISSTLTQQAVLDELSAAVGRD